MANPEHLEILQRGAKEWNRWRDDHVEVYPDLTEADFRDLDTLIEANLSGAQLLGADLRGRCLIGADLQAANLGGADLSGVNLLRANLDRADLSAANLSSADLRGADLSRTRLRGADFAESIIEGTRFADVDLSVARHLDTVQHWGPSTIGIETIYKSNGKIPDAFLRGCGIPDQFIAYVGSLVSTGIEFYSCFISYSTSDKEFAERLWADLQAKGVRCWFASHDVKAGEKLYEQIDKAIRLHDKLLLILSEHSMSSNWVHTEIAKARKREVQEKRQMLFPVALVPYDPVVKEWEYFDADIGIDSAREIREYFIPDFSNWKDHDSYQTAFQRLVKDLKSSG